MSLAKRIALAVAGLVLLGAAALAVFVATFDANRYKGLAIDAAQQKYQRTLAIDGPIELSVFPRLAIKVGKVRLSEHARPKDEFASIGQASLSLQVMPLLRQQLVVDRIDLRSVRAMLVRDAKGVRNIDDLLAKEAGAPGTPASGPAPRFEIGGVKLEDARLTIRDDVAKLAGTVTLSSFDSGRIAPGVETSIALQADIELKQPQALKLALDGKTKLVFDPEPGSVALSAVDLRARGDTAAITGLDARLGAKRIAYGAAQHKLELDAAQLTLTGHQRGSPFEVSIDWPQLAVAGERLQGSGFSGRFKLQGANALAGSFQSGAPSGSFEALRLPGFALKIDGSVGPRKIDGALKANLLLRPVQAAVAFDPLALRANVAEPTLQPLQLAVDGHAGVDARGAQWTLQGALNTNRFSSNGSAAFGAAVPNVQATARFDRLDLNQVLARDAAAAAPAAAPADTPVALDGLAAVNGRFGLSAGQFVLRQYKVVDARLDAALDGGTLRITRLTGGAWGGQIDASGSADARTKRMAIKLAASGVNVNALLKDVAGKDLLEGTGRVTADVTTSGASLGALRSNLAGNAALNLRDGAIKGVNLARSMRQARAAFSLKQDALTRAQASEKTDFSELTATAQIAGGVAESRDLDVKSPFLRLGGAGTFDIGRGRIDYTARATVVGVPAGQDGAEMAALRGVTVPVRLSGPFEAIEWKIQWSGVAAAAVENKLKDKLADKLGAKLGAGAPATGASASAPQKPEDKLKEKLKGLFKK